MIKGIQLVVAQVHQVAVVKPQIKVVDVGCADCMNGENNNKT